MSHTAQRKENNCLNCGTTVIGKYCHNCGQQNVEPKESAGQLVSHFFSDITHFDGKFFSTLKDLLFKPGFLSREYMNGRRSSYLNPVRMYLFTSFIFFLVFFSSFHINDNEINMDTMVDGKTIDQIHTMSQEDFDAFTKALNNGKPMTREGFNRYADSVKKATGIHFTDSNYKTREAYDSVLASGREKHNWFKKKLIYKEIAFNQKYNNDGKKAVQSLIESLTHHFPQMLFISLPFLAFFLKLLYARQKNFYYVSHAIFVLHLYIFIFIALLLSLGISQIALLTSWNWISFLNVLITIIVFFYLYKAMRNFYKQRRAKTIIKYFLLLFSFLFLTIFLFVIFFFVSFFQV